MRRMFGGFGITSDNFDLLQVRLTEIAIFWEWLEPLSNQRLVQGQGSSLLNHLTFADQANLT